MSIDIHTPRVYDYDVDLKTWERMVELQIDVDTGIRASRPGYIAADSMTPEDMHLYNVTIAEAYTMDPADSLNTDERTCLPIVERELGAYCAQLELLEEGGGILW